MNCQLPAHRFKIRPLVNAKGFNTRLVLDGLRAALLRAGITVEEAQSAEDGQDTELAILMTLTPRLPGAMEVTVPVRLNDHRENVKDWNSKLVIVGLRALLEATGCKVAAECSENGRGTELATRVRVVRSSG